MTMPWDQFFSGDFHLQCQNTKVTLNFRLYLLTQFAQTFCSIISLFDFEQVIVNRQQMLEKKAS